MWRWRRRLREVGTLTDRAPGGNPVHGLLPAERAAILEIHDEWAAIDRSHRKLAHRGSYVGEVWVSPSTFRRVLADHGIEAEEAPPSPKGSVLLPWPEWVQWKPNQIWMYDNTHFGAANAVVCGIVDVVSRKWINHHTSTEETSTQIQTTFADALDAEDLLRLLDDERLALDEDDPNRPILLAWSDNGPQMRSESTREFMALVAIGQYFGRPHTPTDQAYIESLWGHIKRDWPHLLEIDDIATLDAELVRVRCDYNTVRLHAGLDYVTPDDAHSGRAPKIRRARDRGLKQARARRIATNRQANKPPGEQPDMD